ncbi:MAG TPA: GNAT family N-acetyltransferase [Pseudonocardiaceae bacterium]|nr:GNAT family N-acetyltransferase [Pseudonocardiaceae bacterium]
MATGGGRVVVRFGVRSGVPADLPVLAEIYRRASLSNAGDAAMLLAHPEALVFGGGGLAEGQTRVVTHTDGRIVGFATMRRAGEFFELEDMFVDPAWMRHGIGRLLVQDAMVIARREHMPRIEVTANPHAYSFYENTGFLHDSRIETELGHGSRMYLDIPQD